MLCWEIWQIFSANAFIIGKRRYEKAELRLMRNPAFYFYMFDIKSYFIITPLVWALSLIP